MKHVLKIGILISSIFVSFAHAKLNTGDVLISKALDVNECFKIAKSVRESFFENSFGEVTLENNYYYNRDDIQISVMCLKSQKLVVVFIATLNESPFKYLRAFEKSFGQ